MTPEEESYNLLKNSETHNNFDHYLLRSEITTFCPNKLNVCGPRAYRRLSRGCPCVLLLLGCIDNLPDHAVDPHGRVCRLLGCQGPQECVRPDPQG
eukprot:XP_001708946.1 Hypothetical protein GL50803_32045 [Giardia lamblia ATCC 50803]